jgi:hypothetical protein
MLIGPVRYILATERLQGPVFTALPGCRATALPLKREVAPTLVVGRLSAVVDVTAFTAILVFARRINPCSAGVAGLEKMLRATPPLHPCLSGTSEHHHPNILSCLKSNT